MTTVTDIMNATNTTELTDLVTAAAAERGVELRDDLSWGEDADRIEIGGLPGILRAAEARWYELEG